MKKVGRVGGKALLYFEVVSTLALIIGLVVINVSAGAGLQRRSRDARRQRRGRLREARATQTHDRLHPAHHPVTFFDAFTGSGDLLQVLFVAVCSATR
jgi:aerobic C4-dicarboxylate transport protein